MSLNGVHLSKQWNLAEMQPKKELHPFIKSNANMEGIIDYEIFIPATKEVVYNSVEAMSRDIPIYQVNDLMSMTVRKDLTHIAEYYGIDTVNKSNQFLIKLIIDAQKMRAEKDGVEAPEPVTVAQVTNAQDRLKGKKPKKVEKEPPKMW
jgi:hypothetical protein